MSSDLRFRTFGGARRPPAHVAARGSTEAAPTAQELSKQLSLQSWDQQKPPTAQDFWSQTATSLTLAAGAGSTVETTAATGAFVQLPTTAIGVLQTAIFVLSAPLLTMNLSFTVRVNGAGIPGLSNVGFPPIAAASLTLPISSTYQLPPGAVISVLFVNQNAIGPWTIGFVLSGYFVSASDVLAYTGQRQGMIETAGSGGRKFLTR